ncbi:zonular occludens toxin domain-containing protein [Pseudomonas tremae]|uniref:zonular occludens toxin domain-containing protein n=1 Tax=Pseudomonas tremae TaxID=200454 RepID=UPI00210ECDAD|nr:zonular occludens toxin domain-containing protein [Pseudomonas tremae]MCQ2990931.1 zonular occludens toxin domain-containing protein [Pseudomonas tremae]
MLKLVTGLPGEGKTSNELWDFLNNPAYSGRPKYCTPIKGFEPALHGVTAIDHIKGWQELPEGAVIFCDEVQDYCGTDLPSQPPEWVKQLARHRHGGYDFIVTTQSPMFLHPFARKLSKPHVHYHRPWNMKMVRYEYEGVQGDPLSKSAKSLAQRKFVTPNPEVFKLYTSTVLDTHKAKPPKKLITLIGIALLMLVAGGYFGLQQVKSLGTPKEGPLSAEHKSAPATDAANQTSMSFTPPVVNLQNEPSTWNLESMKPRVEGLAYTAPIYDSLTSPTDFPRVAACMSSAERGTCKCYSQQGTPLDVPISACFVFVKVGTFDPWLSGRHQDRDNQIAQSPAADDRQSSRSIAAVDGSQEPVKTRGASFTVVADTSRPSPATK